MISFCKKHRLGIFLTIIGTTLLVAVVATAQTVGRQYWNWTVRITTVGQNTSSNEWRVNANTNRRL